MIYFAYEILILWLLVLRGSWKGGYQLLQGQTAPLIVSVLVAGSVVSICLLSVLVLHVGFSSFYTLLTYSNLEPHIPIS